LGETLLALPIDALREVAACPTVLHPMAAGADGIAGALNLRQVHVPVLDLGPRLGQPLQEAGKHKVVVILSWQQRRIGLLVDEVCGMAQARPGQLQPLAGPTADDTPRLTAALASLTDGRCASLLDLDALAAQPGLPWVADQRADHRASSGGAGEGRLSLLLFDADPIPLAIEATDVHTTVPEAEVRPNALTSELCAGVIDHQGRQVPVLDTLRALGLGQQKAASRVSVLLLRAPQGGMLALRLDRVRDITAVPRHAIAPMPAMAVLEEGLFAGVYHCPQRGQHLIIDPAGLLTNEWIRGLAETARPATAGGASPRPGGAAPTAQAAAQQDSYLVFNAGRPYACRLRLVSEIIRYPRDLVVLDGHGELLGLHMHQGSAVPLLCLSRILGHEAPTNIDTVRVLIVERAGQMLGLAVQSVTGIETARWHHRPRSGHEEGDANGMQLGELIEIGSLDGQSRLTVPVLDLDRWLDTMTAPGAAASSRQRLAQSAVECGIRNAGCDMV
jgi:purine-binding chemotaxis protein CheW